MIRELKKAIRDHLLTVHGTVFAETADESQEYPHVIFDLGSVAHEGGQYRGFLDVDVWDRNTSTVNVDNLADGVIKALDRVYYVGEEVAFVAYVSNILNVGSDDETLRRKTVTFEIQFRRIF